MLVDTRSDSTNFHTVHRDYVVKIGIARNPRDERRIGGYVGGFYTAGRKWNVYERVKTDENGCGRTSKRHTFANNDGTARVL